MLTKHSLKYLILGYTVLTGITACNGSSGGSNNGGDVATVASPITIDNAGVVPLIGSSSTSSVIYVHNHTDSTISGIKYSEVVNTGSGQFINPNSAILCSSIPAHQSCPLAFTTPTLATTTAQGSAMLSASYTTNSQARSFSQVINFRRVDINIPQGVVFNSGVQLNSAGNKTAFGTIYAYGSGTGKTYTVSSLQSNKKGVTITQGDITNRQIPSGYVTAIEVSSPADFTTTTQKAANQGYEATLSMASQGGGASFQSSSSIGVAPATSGAILTSSNSTIVDSSVATPGGSIFIVNSGNDDATITGITYPSGVTESSGTTCSGVIPSGNGCVINFATPQTNGDGNITVNYTGGSSGSIAQTIVWYNGKGGALLQMIANPNPLPFSATVGASTQVTISNIGGYDLFNLNASATTFIGAAAAIAGEVESCFTSGGAPVESLPVGGYCTYNVSVTDNATETGQISLVIAGDYTTNSGNVVYTRAIALGYISNEYRPLLISSPDPLTIQVVGNNESTTAQVMTISNNGEATATISSQALAGGAPVYLTESSSDCGATLDAGDDCTATFILGPTTAETQISNSTTYDITYSGGQTVSTILNADIDYVVQANNQNIIINSITTGADVTDIGGGYTINGNSTNSAYITLIYQNTGTNPIQITGINNTNSPISWEIDLAASTCYNGSTLPSNTINPTGICSVQFNNVLSQYSVALNNSLSTTYQQNITVPTIIFRDTQASGTQFEIQAEAPAPISSTTIPVSSTQAIIVNSLTVGESVNNECINAGLSAPCIRLTHQLTNADGYSPITVITNIESYFILPPSLNAGCSINNNESNTLTQTCILTPSDGEYTSTSYYQIGAIYMGQDLHALFSLDTTNMILSFSPLSAAIIYTNNWTWAGGSSAVNQLGVYGERGVESSTNIPGARRYSMSWTDNSGNLWLFAGSGFGNSGGTGTLNDLWKYNLQTGLWTWMKGTGGTQQLANYGTKQQVADSNRPGARYNAMSWTDNSGNLWLFGGFGFATSSGVSGGLNDLWKYTPQDNNWVWISGSNELNQTGSYGTKGIESSTNIPSARNSSVSWLDNAGNLWLFGGIINNDTAQQLNDLWKYNINTNSWTWISGESTTNSLGVYGTINMPNAANIPGARYDSISWVDSSGNLWLFGGSGNDSANTQGALNDLWKYSVADNEWTWVSGSNTVNNTGNYGTKNQAALSNIPGARYDSISWIDSSDNLWLFGGNGYSSSDNGSLNDLWKYNIQTGLWVWVNGSNQRNEVGNYGNLGQPLSTNVVGARYGSISWIDNSNNLWLFGGFGYNATTSNRLNDLWKYRPLN